jgi:hypothetical protein
LTVEPPCAERPPETISEWAMKAVLGSGVAVAVVASLLTGCGKPENSAYTQNYVSPEQEAALKTPLPPGPAWAGTVVGRPVSAIAKGTAACKGAVDLTLKHAAGGRVGDELQGWAWDPQSKAAPTRVLLTDASAKVIGAGEVDRDRPDVQRAVPAIKTPRVGWTVITRATAGVANVVGVLASGALCTIAPAQLS